MITDTLKTDLPSVHRRACEGLLSVPQCRLYGR
jgi:hypothetical protein